MTRLSVDSVAGWKNGVREHFLPLEFSVGRPDCFHGSFTLRALRDTQLALVHSDAHRVTRTRALAERSEHGWFKVFWQLAGASLVQQGRNASHLTRGTWTFYDTTRPYDIELGEDSRFAVMLLPHDTCQAWKTLASERAGQTFRTDGAARVALVSVLAALRDDEDFTMPAADAVIGAIASLLESAMWEREEEASPGATPRMAEVRNLVLDRVDDPDLSPASLAAALRVSRRTLYAWFEKLGQSPYAFIQQVRLEQCRQSLGNPAERRKTITRIAFDHGFSDAAHFSRLFRQAYGTSPREYRERCFPA